MRRLLWVGLAIAISLHGRSAAAASVDSERTHQLLLDGAALFDQGDFEKALARFTAAYEISGSPKVLFDIAQCQLALLRPTEAATNFRQFLELTATDPAMAQSDFRARAQQRLSRLDAQLGQIYVLVTPPGAQVVLDGKVVTIPRQYVSAAPATHTISALAPGYQPSTRAVSVPAGRLSDVSFTLSKEGVPALAAASSSASATTATASGPDRLPADVAGGAAAVVAVSALVLGVVTQGQYNALPINRSGQSTPAENRVLTQARITDVLWAVAAVGAGVGTYLWFSAGPSPGGGGEVAVGGRF